MLTILRRKLLNPNTLTLNSSTNKFRVLQIKCPINTYCSSQSSHSLDSQPNSTFSDKKREKFARVLSLFKTHGFTETQIWNLGRVCPQILSSNPQKTLAPKIEFLLSIGISKAKLPEFVLSNPDILESSLENHLIPHHNFLKSVVVDDSDVISMLNRDPRILNHDCKKDIALNISTLMGIGVSESGIQLFLVHVPEVARQNHSEFKRKVMNLIRMGLNPTNCVFVYAIHSFYGQSSTFRFFDIPDDDHVAGFRAVQSLSSSIGDKMKTGTEFFVKEMGYQIEDIFSCGRLDPFDIFYTLENRCRVIKALISKGMLKKDISPATFLTLKESQFLDQFVNNYEDKVPGLLNAYLGLPYCSKIRFGSKD